MNRRTLVVRLRPGQRLLVIAERRRRRNRCFRRRRCCFGCRFF